MRLYLRPYDTPPSLSALPPRCPAAPPPSRLPLGPRPFGDDERRRALTDRLLGDDDLAHVLPVGQVKHDVGHHGLQDGPESAGAGTAFESPLGHCPERLRIERETDVLQLEQLLVLLGEGVL